MSLFKRKGRRISIFEDEGPGDASLGAEDSTSEPAIQVPVKFGKRPPKLSALRRSTNVDDGADRNNDDDNKEDDDGPAVVRPSTSRSGSTRAKKRTSLSARLSFGVGAASDADEATAEDRASATTTPRRTGIASLSQRVLETNAFRKSLSGRLPTRPLDTEGEDRPRYSKEHLEELQSATPNAPRNVSSKKREGGEDGGDGGDGDAMQLDASELEGATVVEPSDLAALRTGAAPAAHVLTQTEIQERKDRRARLALEQNAIALGSDEDDEENGYISLVVSGGGSSKKKKESRLVREDEDLGEGYDEFVEDGGLSLGRKAEREARRRRKQEMATLISAAEGSSSGGGGGGGGDDGGDHGHDDVDSDDDSEAERQAAYNAAQTRAGMDGLKQRAGRSRTAAAAADDDEDAMNVLRGSSGAGVASLTLPKMRPLPELADCLARMQRIVQNLEDEVALRRKKLAEAEAEKADILAREAEVQEFLNKAGQQHQAVAGSRATADPTGPAAALLAATQSPLRPLAAGPVERGLESLGGTPAGTPARRTDLADIF